MPNELVLDRETLHALARVVAPVGTSEAVIVNETKLSDLAVKLANATATRGALIIKVVD